MLTLKYRQYHGDMIEVFKIIKGIYDSTCVPHLDLVKLSDAVIRTRGTNNNDNDRLTAFDPGQPE